MKMIVYSNHGWKEKKGWLAVLGCVCTIIPQGAAELCIMYNVDKIYECVEGVVKRPPCLRP